MCARTTLAKQRLRDIADELEAEFSTGDEALYRPRYNVAPSDQTWIVERRGDGRVLVPAVWGYIGRDRALINVRGEQVASGGGFRDAFAHRRCVLVTDGFYEWDKKHRPTWFHRPDGRLVLLAGIFQPPRAAAVPSRADRPAADRFPRFTVVTTRPNRVVGAVHDRMPVVVAAAAVDDWLGAEPVEAARLIAPAGEDVLEATAVSTRANSAKNDDPMCIQPVERSGEDPQRSLF